MWRSEGPLSIRSNKILANTTDGGRAEDSMKNLPQQQSLCPGSREHVAVRKEVLLPWAAGPRSPLDVVLTPSLPLGSRSGRVALLRNGFCSLLSFYSAPVFPPSLSKMLLGPAEKLLLSPCPCWDTVKVKMKKKILKLVMEKTLCASKPLRAGFCSSPLPTAVFCLDVLHAKCGPWWCLFRPGSPGGHHLPLCRATAQSPRDHSIILVGRDC